MINNLKLKALREDNDLFQESIAKSLNIQRRTYASYELQENAIPIEILCKIAIIYNVSIQYICGLTDNKEPYGEFKQFDKKRFLDTIKNLRLTYQMTEEELSKKLNCKPQTICQYEKGKRKVPLEVVIKLSKIYDLTIDQILNITANNI